MSSGNDIIESGNGSLDEAEPDQMIMRLVFCNQCSKRANDAENWLKGLKWSQEVCPNSCHRIYEDTKIEERGNKIREIFTVATKIATNMFTLKRNIYIEVRLQARIVQKKRAPEVKRTDI